MDAKKFHLKNHRGATLLYGLLVMMIVTAIATVVGTLTVRQIQEGRAVKDAVIAYYGAESALEASLYLIAEARFFEDDVNLTLNQTLDRVDDLSAEWAGQDTTIPELTIDITKTESFTPNIKTALDENETLQLDFFDPADAVPLNQINLSWDDAENDKPMGQMEVTSTGWNTSGDFFSNSRSWPLVISTGQGSAEVNIREVGMYSYYRVRIKMIDGSVQGLLVSAKDTSGGPLDIPSHFSITATGKYANSKQAVSILAPWKLPSSALGDFVLFSDDELIKEFDPIIP